MQKNQDGICSSASQAVNSLKEAPSIKRSVPRTDGGKSRLPGTRTKFSGV